MEKANRKPNKKCPICLKDFYVRPGYEMKLKNPAACSTSCANRLRSHDQLYTPQAIAKRVDKMKGEKNPAWSGGRYIEPKKGYVMIRKPDHHRARQNGYVLEHILVMEKVLNRELKKGEEIHHRNGDRTDNRPENLELFSNHKDHFELHLPLVAKYPNCKCGRKHTSKGMCSRCLAYFRRTGRHRTLEDIDLRKMKYVLT